MKEIILKMQSPKEAETLVLLLFKNGFQTKSATISYNIRKGLPGKFRRLDQYPLTLHGILNGQQTRILVTPLTAGHRCDASYALMRILKAANFYVEPDDIFTVKRFDPTTGYLNLTYSK